ncbi:ABC transporter permease subunit [Flaviflexus huanghaiensis]|uniref:ABC transporter permease subunit n=1 Tax=Flaviflexus huanghaiensis TaxID=1111473 RepID=UPI0015FAAD6B
MSPTLLTHEIRTRRVGAATLAVVLGAFGLLAMTLADALGSLLNDITDSFPEALRTFIGADAPGGYVVGEMFSLIFPIAVVTFAIIVGAGTLAGEERDGTMAILASQPVSRTRLLWTKATGVALAIVGVIAVNWVVMALFIAAGATELSLTGLMGATVHLYFLGVAFAAIALAGAAATGRPAAGSAIAGAVAVTAYLAATMLPIAGLDGWAHVSPWYYYLLNSDPLRTGVTWTDIAIFAVIAAIAMVIATVAFRRRDLKG